jgi:pimeloyl-ACP methyl ester carboxylesterase
MVAAEERSIIGSLVAISLLSPPSRQNEEKLIKRCKGKIGTRYFSLIFLMFLHLPPMLLITILLIASLASASAFQTPRGHLPTPLVLASPLKLSTVAENTSAKSTYWKWRGHEVFAESRVPSQISTKPAVILLHGFGASTTYWRETMTALHSEGYEVHALDLLGQGRSAKPTDGSIEYSINLWANMVDDYAAYNNLGTNGVVLVGNSLGSLAALAAATSDFAQQNQNTYLSGNDGEGSRVKGICLFNCAVGLNSRNVLKNPSLSPLQKTIFGWIFDVLNTLIFDNEVLLRYALNNIVTKELLRDALKSLYLHSPDRVDDELVDSFYYPAKNGGEGAVEAIRQIYTNDAGLTPMEIHEKYPMLDNIPLHLIWGDEDAVTPITGDVGTFYCDRVANNRGGRGLTTIDVIKSGHMPFDDNPIDAHEKMLSWLEKKVR